MREFHVRRDGPRALRHRRPAVRRPRRPASSPDLAAIRRLAARMNAGRPPGAPGGLGRRDRRPRPAPRGRPPARSPATRTSLRPGRWPTPLDDLRTRLGPDGGRASSTGSPTSSRAGGHDPGAAAGPPRGAAADPGRQREPGRRPAARARRRPRRSRGRRATATRSPASRRSSPPARRSAPDGGSLLELMRTPARRAPTSLAGQLRYIREALGRAPGRRALEPHRAGWTSPSASWPRRSAASTCGSVAGRGRHERGRGAVVRPMPADEPEAFSSDSAWMPQRRADGQEHVRLARPAVARLRPRRSGRSTRSRTRSSTRWPRWGVTGLWLIGLWERSKASERIKRMRGNPDAVASAYSLDDYRIADDLGGEAAYANLRDRAWARGIRLASDMVPNHMGIDSRWVIEHPEWFLSLPRAALSRRTPSTGPDLSADERVGIVLEDHYWDDSDAAVVFKRFDRWSGDERYVYHGNDGTSFPWNDTAQLDFLEAGGPRAGHPDDPRRRPALPDHPLRRRDGPRQEAHPAAVVAGAGRRRRHPVARRARACPKAEFDARMPVEFWREVVDRVAAEVPGTLLLAEAFWMLEGYFVRTLGMHRVYNSAFMHMLRDEDGAGYRKVIKRDPRVRPRDPQALRQLHEQPRREDRARAVRQGRQVLRRRDGHGDAARAADARATARSRASARSTAWSSAGRRSTSARIRGWSSATSARSSRCSTAGRGSPRRSDFLLYDFVTDGGGVDEQVLAYSNGRGPTRSLVLYHDRFGIDDRDDPRVGAVRAQEPATGRKRLVRRSLADGPRPAERPGDVRGLPRRADRARVRSARAGRSASAACG